MSLFCLRRIELREWLHFQYYQRCSKSMWDHWNKVLRNRNIEEANYSQIWEKHTDHCWLDPFFFDNKICWHAPVITVENYTFFLYFLWVFLVVSIVFGGSFIGDNNLSQKKKRNEEMKPIFWKFISQKYLARFSWNLTSPQQKSSEQHEVTYARKLHYCSSCQYIHGFMGYTTHYHVFWTRKHPVWFSWNLECGGTDGGGYLHSKNRPVSYKQYEVTYA